MTKTAHSRCFVPWIDFQYPLEDFISLVNIYWLKQRRSKKITNLLNHHERHEGVHFVGEDFVQGVAVVLQRDTTVRGHVVDVNILVNVNDKLAFWMYLSEK